MSDTPEVKVDLENMHDMLDTEDFDLPGDVAIPPEFADIATGMQTSIRTMLDPEVKNPNSEKYNPYMGAGIGTMLKSFLQMTPYVGIRTIAEIADYVDYIENPDGTYAEVKRTIPRARIAGIVEGTIEPTSSEEQCLYEIMMKLVARDAQNARVKDAKKARLKTKTGSVLKRPVGMNRAEWRRLQSKKK